MLPKHKNHELLDMSERLQSLEEYSGLTDLQKSICYIHVQEPSLNKAELARRAGCDRGTIYEFFASKKWDAINRELAQQQLRELVQLSIHTLKKSMLHGTSSVALDAATRVLVNAGLLVSPHGKQTINKTDNKLVVVYEDKFSGNPNPVPSPSETAGSPRLEGPLQGDCSGSTVGQNDACHQ